MKSVSVGVFFLLTSILFGQTFKGKNDLKFGVGYTVQKGGSGIQAATDFGIGENMSYGFTSTYLLTATNEWDNQAKFLDRFDLKARFNANIGNVFGIDKNIDIYPGLNLGLRNFGGHIGVRYFFTNGFGLYSETSVPFARYKTTLEGYDYLNNQVVFTIGACFNL